MTDDLLNKRSRCTQIMKIILITLHVAYLALFGFLPALQAEPAVISKFAAIPPPTSTQAQTNWAALSNVTPTNSSDDFFGNSAITGKITGYDGITPVSNIDVYAHRLNTSNKWEFAGWTMTDLNGIYILGFLPAGRYQISFSQDAFGTHLTEYYNNVFDSKSAQIIVVGNDMIVKEINASLSEKGKISGLVTASDGVTPLQGVIVQAYSRSIFNASWIPIRYVFTKADGSYLIESLDPGIYRIGFSQITNGIATVVNEFFNNVPKIEEAEDIEAKINSAVIGINASLVEKGKITGVVTWQDGVTPISGISVTAHKFNVDGVWKQEGFGAATDSSGRYTIRGLTEGNYKIEFSDSRQKVYASTYYQSGNLESSTSVFVGENATIRSINTSLLERGKITGRLSGANGGSMDRILVGAYRWKSNSGYSFTPENSVRTETDGTYSLQGLESGIYRIKFSEEASGYYAVEYYNHKNKITDAEDIIVSDGTTVSGINALLTEKGKIIGKVTGPDGVLPLTGIHVNALRKRVDGTWNFEGSTTTNADGNYTLGGLAAGTYRVYFFDFNNHLFLAEYYYRTTVENLAKELVLEENGTISGIDVSLAEKGKIMGRVTGPDGITPIQGISVEASFLEYGEWSNWDDTTTQVNGDYVFPGLKEGSYRIKFTDVNNEFYDSEYYNDVSDFDSAMSISVGEGVAVGGINASLNRLRAKIELFNSGKSLGTYSNIDFTSSKNKPLVVTKYFTIKNVGNINFERLKIRIAGDRFSNFKISSLKKDIVPPGGSTTFRVTYKPSTVKNIHAKLLVTSNSGVNMFIIRLSAQGKNRKPKGVFVASGPASFLIRSCLNPLTDKIMFAADLTGESKFNTLTVFKSPRHSTAQGSVEVSTDLLDWFSGSDHTTVITDNETFFKVRDNIPVTKAQKRFIRLKDQAR